VIHFIEKMNTAFCGHIITWMGIGRGLWWEKWVRSSRILANPQVSMRLVCLY